MKEKTRECRACGKPITFHRGTKPINCPHCGSPWWDLPRDEFKLFTLQKEYIDSGRDPKKLAEMYETLVFYSENIIKQNLKGKAIYEYDELYGKAEDMAITILQSYLKKPEYEIKFSFGGILKKVALGVMYNNTTKFADQALSLDQEICENLSIGDNPSRFMGDTRERAEITRDVAETYEKEHPEDVVNNIMNIVHDNLMDTNNFEGRAQGILYLVMIKNFLNKKSKTKKDEFLDYYGDKMLEYYDDTLEAVKKELRGE